MPSLAFLRRAPFLSRLRTRDPRAPAREAGRSALACACALLFAALALGCTSATKTPIEFAYNTSSPGVSLSSQPPGARVLIDGEDSGFFTPCVLALDRDEKQRVRFELPGYEPALRVLEPNTRRTYIPWSDGDLGSARWRFPLFLPLGAVLVPLKVDDSHSPWRVHVKLRLSAQP